MHRQPDQDLGGFDQRDAAAEGGATRGGRVASDGTGEDGCTSSSSVQPPVERLTEGVNQLSGAEDAPIQREDDPPVASGGSGQPPIQRPDPGGTPVVRRRPGTERGAAR